MGNCFSTEEEHSPHQQQQRRRTSQRQIIIASPEPTSRASQQGNNIRQAPYREPFNNISNNNNYNVQANSAVPAAAVRPKPPTLISSSSSPVVILSNELQYRKNEMISLNVFEGFLSGRRVAVKFGDKNLIEKEIRHQWTLEHPNILNYFLRSDIDNKTYLISEFYKNFLTDHVKLQIPARSIMNQLTMAVQYMQSHNIVHLDIAPDNIIIIKHDSDFTVKLTNFEYAEKITRESVNIRGVYNLKNALKGYTPPEVRVASTAIKRSDIWSLGRVLAELKMDHGGNGGGNNRNARGRNGKNNKNYKKEVEDPYVIDINKMIKSDSNENVLCKDLLAKMLIADFTLRLSATEALQHPFFWSTQETLNFILEISIMLENGNDFRGELFKGSQRVVGGGKDDKGWTSRIGKKLVEEIQKSRQAYSKRIAANIEDLDSKKITSLITTIRNMMVHAKSAEVLEIVGNDDKFLKFWTTRFPLLIMHLYDAKRRFDNKEN